MEDTLQSLTDKLNNKLKEANLYYLSNDPERALGLERILKNYHIVHMDRSQYLPEFERLGLSYYCLENELPSEAEELYRSSIRLIRSPQFKEYFEKTRKATNYLQTFKISPAFEMAVVALNAGLVNTTSELNRSFEGKLSQFQHLNDLPVSLPKSKIAALSSQSYLDLVKEFGENFVVQFDRGHTGSGTVFVSSEEPYEKLLKDFPLRSAKFSEFVKGSAYTLNAAVLRQGIVMGGLSRQITGISELTPEAGGTVGNDWYYHKDWVSGYGSLIKEVATIGEYMRAQGYFGMFGVDLIVLEDGRHKFIEINARQPASIPMFTRIQLSEGQIPLSMLHLAEFLDIDYKLDVESYNSKAMAAKEFSQIFVRALKDSEVRFELKAGYYRLQGDNAAIDRVSQEVKPNTIFLDEDRDKALLLVADGYDISRVEQAGMVLLAPVKGRKVKRNEEIGRLQLRHGAFTDTGELKPWISEALKAIREYQI